MKKIVTVERPAYEVQCLRCRKTFVTVSDIARYCSPACRQADYRDRKEKQTHK